MNRAHQQKRDQHWFSLVSLGIMSIKDLAQLSGVHRNTISNAVNKIRKQRKEAHAHTK